MRVNRECLLGSNSFRLTRTNIRSWHDPAIYIPMPLESGVGDYLRLMNFSLLVRILFIPWYLFKYRSVKAKFRSIVIASIFKVILESSNIERVYCFDDNSQFVHMLCLFCPNIQFEVFQNGFRAYSCFEYLNTWDPILFLSQNLIRHVYGERDTRLAMEFGIPVSRFKKSGSVLLNSYAQLSEFAGNSTLLPPVIVSQFENSHSECRAGTVGYETYVAQKAMFKFCGLVFSRLNIKPLVLLRSLTASEQASEIEFISSYFGRDVIAIPRIISQCSDPLISYKLLGESKLIIGVNSSLLFEFQSLGRSVLFIDFDSENCLFKHSFELIDKNENWECLIVGDEQPRVEYFCNIIKRLMDCSPSQNFKGNKNVRIE